jgi:hypothetical protein
MTRTSHALAIVRKFCPEVTRVVSGKKAIYVEVKPEDGKGHKKEHTKCAMAAACTRELKLDTAIFARSTAYLVKGKVARRYKIGSAAREEIVAFDRSGIFTPGLYKLYADSQTPTSPDPNRSREKTGHVVRARKEISGLRAILSA